MATELHKFTTNHWIIPLTWENFMVHKFCLYKAVKNKTKTVTNKTGFQRNQWGGGGWCPRPTGSKVVAGWGQRSRALRSPPVSSTCGFAWVLPCYLLLCKMQGNGTDPLANLIKSLQRTSGDVRRWVCRRLRNPEFCRRLASWKTSETTKLLSIDFILRYYIILVALKGNAICVRV